MIYPDKAPPCLKCKHFFTTWELQHPRGCKIFNFKGKQIPSLAVFSSTGKHCPQFERKKKER